MTRALYDFLKIIERTSAKTETDEKKNQNKTKKQTNGYCAIDYCCHNQTASTQYSLACLRKSPREIMDNELFSTF